MCRAPGSDGSRHGRGSCSRSCASHGRSLRRPPPIRRRRSRPPPRAVAAVALERQYTVRAPVAAHLCHPLPAAHGGDGHDAASSTAISISAGLAVLALGGSSTRHGPRTGRAASAPGTHQVQVRHAPEGKRPSQVQHPGTPFQTSTRTIPSPAAPGGCCNPRHGRFRTGEQTWRVRGRYTAGIDVPTLCCHDGDHACSACE
jgi:hypothetical protein